jgi:hypothetical protein
VNLGLAHWAGLDAATDPNLDASMVPSVDPLATGAQTAAMVATMPAKHLRQRPTSSMT